MKIYPSIMGKSQKKINVLFRKYEEIVKELHLDVADGKFVPNKSLWFRFKLSHKFKYNAHLMVKNPLGWIKENGSRVDLCIVSFEAVKDVGMFIDYMKKRRKKVAFSLNPETKVSSVKGYLQEVDVVLILTVHPGFYGAKYLKSPLRKIAQIKKINPKIKIIVDGGMNPNTICDAKRAGADAIVSGSYLAKAENVRKAIRELKNHF